MTQEASRQKSPREKFITRFARVYTPGVVGLALLVATIPPLMGMGTFQEWIYTALTFLVISCPCALVISVPLAFFAGLGGASRAGVLVRGAAGIEALAKTKAVAFDKTGTLTEGAFQVTGIVPYGAVMREQLLEACALAEQFSTHPIARSILDYYGKAPRPDAVRDVIDVKGRGVSAVVAHKRVLSGNALLLSENGVDIPDQLPGGSVVCVAVDNRYAGYITLGDSPKKEAKQTIATLKSLGIWTVMLTGDNESAAADVASGLGIDDYHAGLLPQDKVTHIERLKDTYSGTTVFVGDGINDAPALATADVGISMGGLGSDAAIEASDVVLMTDEVSKLVSAIRSSRKTLSIVTQNIVLSLGIKGGMMLLGLFGISSMWLAIVADVGAALLAVLNSVRALKIPRR
jgi:Cd2+/Zn2+-exporting ATPase